MLLEHFIVLCWVNIKQGREREFVWFYEKMCVQGIAMWLMKLLPLGSRGLSGHVADWNVRQSTFYLNKNKQENQWTFRVNLSSIDCLFFLHNQLELADKSSPMNISAIHLAIILWRNVKESMDNAKRKVFASSFYWGVLPVGGDFTDFISSREKLLRNLTMVRMKNVLTGLKSWVK